MCGAGYDRFQKLIELYEFHESILDGERRSSLGANPPCWTAAQKGPRIRCCMRFDICCEWAASWLRFERYPAPNMSCGSTDHPSPTDEELSVSCVTAKYIINRKLKTGDFATYCEQRLYFSELQPLPIRCLPLPRKHTLTYKFRPVSKKMRGKKLKIENTRIL